MVILILNTDYDAFLREFYCSHPQLRVGSYDEQMRARNDSLFGTADFYSTAFRKKGHEAYDIHINNEILQKAWAAEHGLAVPLDTLSVEFFLRKKVVPWLRRKRTCRWLNFILSEQIRYFRPDIILNHNMVFVPKSVFAETRAYYGKLMAQIGSPISGHHAYDFYDMVFSPVPHLVEEFCRVGITARYLRLGFGRMILAKVKSRARDIPVSFVGSVGYDHLSRRKWLEAISSKVNLSIWSHPLDKNDPLQPFYRGEAWGAAMYDVLVRSKITLNHHLDFAGEFAANMRLFEATGSGAMLITDWKKNLHEFFDLDKEVIGYQNIDESVARIQYFLEHDREREQIAQAGQQRTLTCHLYEQRIQELLDMIENP